MTPEDVPQITDRTLTRSRKIKRMNAIAAILAGGAWGLAVWALFPATLESVMLGLLAGLIWGNAFEYVYHRWILHWNGGIFARRHMVHHRATGTPDETEHLTFGESPLWILLLFLVNGIPAFVADRILRLGFAPGILFAFSAYFVAVEEIHWRIHLGERLPRFIEPARKYHLSHHDRPDGRYSVFFPLFDWMLGTAESRSQVAQGHGRPIGR